jgi:serine phosphatase RsbU (regulator of sigma subunit)
MNDVSEQLLKQEQEVQLRLAHQVQQQFYRPAPNLSGFDIAGAAYPAYETSGDYFDFITMPHGSLCIAVGDVEGHGFGSALVMALTRAYVRSFVALGLEVDQILTQVNRMLLQDLGDGFFVTLALASLDVRNRSLVYAGAGHVPGYILNESGMAEHTLESNGLPLGLFHDIRYSRNTASLLRAGEIVVLWTDGVTESSGPGGSEFGVARALECVRQHREASASSIVDRLYRTAREFASAGVQSDDITSVILKVQQE